MNYKMLNEDKFKGKPNSELEKILCKIINCYYLMIENEMELINKENFISDVFYNKYLNDNIIRNKFELNDYKFGRDNQENNNISNPDFQIITEDTFKDTNAYYIIECKRLDNKNTNGINGLNNKYIEEGIKRFTSGKYSTYKNTNAMIGYVVEKMDIDKNITHINNLLTKKIIICTKKKLQKKIILQNFNYSYTSEHHNANNSTITLYHLMFDFYKNIQ